MINEAQSDKEGKFPNTSTASTPLRSRPGASTMLRVSRRRRQVHLTEWLVDLDQDDRADVHTLSNTHPNIFSGTIGWILRARFLYSVGCIRLCGPMSGATSTPQGVTHGAADSCLSDRLGEGLSRTRTLHRYSRFHEAQLFIERFQVRTSRA